ncbi:MAG: DUF1080 domain-containing protein [Pirellulales bacterium]
MQTQSEEPFDPYDAWFQIPKHEQPPNFYRLLGISLFESRPNSIEDAYEQRMINLRSRQVGPRALFAERLKNELTQAVQILRDDAQRAQYDAYLRSLQAQAAPATPSPAVSAPTAPAPAEQVSISTTSSSTSRSSKPKSQSSLTAESIKVILAGLAAIPLAILCLYYGFQRDPLNLFASKSDKPNPKQVITSPPVNPSPAINKTQPPPATPPNPSSIPAPTSPINTPSISVTPPTVPPGPNIPAVTPNPPANPAPPTSPTLTTTPPRTSQGPKLVVKSNSPLPQGLKRGDPLAGYLAIATEGAWAIADDELYVTATEEEAIVFGDPNWTDYRFSLEFQKINGGDVIGILFRAPDPQHRYQLMIGCLDNAWCNLEYFQLGKTRGSYNNAANTSDTPLPQLATPNVIKMGEWQKLSVVVQGSHAQCTLDNRPVFDFPDVKFNRGAVGIRTWGTSARFRNIQVETLDSPPRLLWSGLPLLPIDDSLDLASALPSPNSDPSTPPDSPTGPKKKLKKRPLAKASTPPPQPPPVRVTPTRGYSPEQQALALQPLEDELKSFAAKMETNRKGMLDDFDQAIGLVLGKKSKWSASKNPTQQEMADQLRQEKTDFDRFGYLPFSEPMRRNWSNYFQKGSRAEQVLVTAFKKQVDDYKTNGQDELASILENEMKIMFEKTIVARWRSGAGEWTLYSNFTADGPSGTAPWEVKGNAFIVHWTLADGEASVDTCNLSPLGNSFDGVGQRGNKFRGTAISPR